MATPKPPQTTPLSLNLAPMVDVVMCLIIFFMLATKLVERENLPLDLPAASTAREADKRELGRRVVINVQADPAAPARPPRYVIGDRPLGLPAIAVRLEREHERDAQVRCVIRAERELPYAYVESLLLICAKTGIANVTFGVAREDRGDRP